MKQVILWLCMVCPFWSFSAEKNNSQLSTPLRFKKGKFKIAQLTDIHWHPNSTNTAKTQATILSVLQTEQPDLIVLTGDIITETPT